MYTYMLVLNDYGIRPKTIWFLADIQAPMPAENDQYDIYDNVWDSTRGIWTTRYGNSRVSEPVPPELADDGHEKLAWDLSKHGRVDIRLYYAMDRDPSAWTKCRWDPKDDSYPKIYRYSHITDYPICYTTEALKYAQAAYLVSIVTVQAAGLISAKTRNLSLYQQQMINGVGNFGLFFEFALVATFLYIPFINIALTTRQIAFPHFAVPSMSFYIAIFFYDELRKIMLRKGLVKDERTGRMRQKGWIVQNTYY